MKLRQKLLLLLFISISICSYAQDQEGGYAYTREVIWGINKNTSDGLIGGVVGSISKSVSDKTYETFGIELVNIKHSKELRVTSPNGNFFIYGKENYLYSIRGQYGRTLILFRKAPQQGVQVSAKFMGGPSIGIIAPYYVEIGQATNSQTTRTVRVPFNGNMTRREILGTGSLFQGIQDSDIAIGGNAKIGLSFEFGAFKSNVTGFEVGFLLDAYTRKIPIVVGTEAKSIFPTAFVTVFYGSRR